MLRYRRALAVATVAVLACGCGTVQLGATPTAQLSATATTPTPVATSATGTPTAAPGTTTATPVPLTDTGYKAPDGSPLYKECISPGLPLPPQIPTPVSVDIIATPVNRNEGATPPATGELPGFDPLALPQADMTGWTIYTSPCFGFALRIAPGWSLLQTFTPAGYQQGESGSLGTSDKRQKMDIYYFYTPADELGLAMAAVGGGNHAFIVSEPSRLSIEGHDAVMVYALIREGGAAYVKLSLVVRHRSDSYYTASMYVDPPYDQSSFAAGLTMMESVHLP